MQVFLSIAEGKSGPGMGHGSHPVGGNEAGSDPTTAKNGENAALKPKAANSDSKILQSTGAVPPNGASTILPCIGFSGQIQVHIVRDIAILL